MSERPLPQQSDSGAFRIVRRTTVPVTTYKTTEEVVLVTDDWLEAERAYRAEIRRPRPKYGPEQSSLKGTHPTHTIEDDGTRCGNRGCSVCGAPDNGCFKIHAPCGFEFNGPIINLLEPAAMTGKQ